MATADELKAKGNTAFQAGKNTEAVNWFTQAIALDPNNHVLYSNRSAAYCAEKQYGQALKDGKKTTELKPDWGKGYSRVGAALYGLERWAEARDAYQEGLKIEPDNQACKDGLQQANAAMNSGREKNPFAEIFGPDTLDRIRANPKLAHYLQQPDYVNMINLVVSNPQMVNMLMQQDKRLMETFLHLAGMGNMKMGPMDEDEEEERPKPAPKPKQEAKSASAVDPETKEKRAKAEAEKEKGNEHYKKKQFDEALVAYDRAIEIDSENLLYRLNKAAVYLEQKETQKCLQECDQTMEAIRGRKPYDFALAAKALARKATASHRSGDYDAAIKFYKESLTEHRTADVLDKLNKLEREKKEKEVQAYLSPEKAVEAKERGNTFFRECKFPEAIKEYSEAVKRDPKNPTYYSNRAAAYMKLGEYQMAINDADEALKLDPTFVKAMVRKAQSYYFRKEYHKALDWYEKGLVVDKDNEECKNGIERTIQQVQQSADSGQVDEDRVRKAMADPEIQHILQDPIMQSVLRECGESPGAINTHMKNPGVAEKIRKLMMAGVLRTG